MGGCGVGRKIITISEEAYELLVSHKMEGESFTEEIKRILGHAKRGSILEHKGKWVMRSLIVSTGRL